MKKALAVLTVLGACGLYGSQVFAACPTGVSLPMYHFLDSYFACDNSKPVSAFAYQVTAPTTVHSGTENLTPAAFQGPGVVRINSDWGNPLMVGCPQGAGGNARLMLVVQASDGTGVIASISGNNLIGLYAVETAHPYNTDTGEITPLPCVANNGRPRLNSFTTNTVDIHVDPIQLYTDCLPGTLGTADPALGGLDSCLDGFTSPAVGIGGIYTRSEACGTKPDVRRASWVRSTATLDAGGNATVPYTKPDNTGKTCATDPTCLCAFIGTTTSIDGVEGGSINGFIQVAGSLAAPPTAENVRAATDSGKVKLSWSTSNEVGLAGFRLIAVSKNKGQFEIGSLVAAKGSSSSYTAEVRMGDLKGSRSIIIRSVLTDGTTVDAAPVNF